MDYEKLSVSELEEMAKDALKAAERKKVAVKAELADKVHEMIKEAGFSFDDIFPSTSSKSKSKTSSVAKYRHPENAENTWTGRGRMPKWLKEAIEGGATVDDFAI